MIEPIELVDVPARHLAAVKARAGRDQLGATIMASLDKVYALLRGRGVTGLGHNVVVYRDPARGMPFELEIGVETPAPIVPPEGEVEAITLPAARAAVVAYWGPYDKMIEGHAAMQAWLAERGLKARDNVEVYGDHDDDPAKLRTDLVYILVDA